MAHRRGYFRDRPKCKRSLLATPLDTRDTVQPVNEEVSANNPACKDKSVLSPSSERGVVVWHALTLKPQKHPSLSSQPYGFSLRCKSCSSHESCALQGFCTVDPVLWSDMQKQLQDLKEEQDWYWERCNGLRFQEY